MLEVRLLADMSVRSDDGSPVGVRYSRALALVAYLALNAGTPQSRHVIAGTFWPESGDAQALTNLRRELHHLRQLLGDTPALTVGPRQLCWLPDRGGDVDVHRFEAACRAARAALAAGEVELAAKHAEEALSGYAGPLLPEVDDDWAAGPRQRLQREAVAMCDVLARPAVAQVDPALALAAARRRVELEPLQEGGYRTLMTLLAATGDRAGAVAAYHRCATVLESELGVTPEEETRALHRRLRDDRRPAVAGPGPSPGQGPVPLLGRDAELDRLLALWRAAAAGRAGAVLVAGEAGVGKTRLVAELARAADAGGAVVAGSRCFGASGRVALTPVADWLGSPRVRAAAARLEPVWRHEVERLLPVSAGQEPSQGADSADPEPWQRHRFFEGLTRGVLATRRPLLLTLDDVQWCDEETLAFAGHLLGVAARAPLMLAVTLRTGRQPLPGHVADWLAGLDDTGRLNRVEVLPMGAGDVGRLAEALRGTAVDEQERGLLHAATGGYPLHVVEVVRSGRDRAPQSVSTDLSDVLRRRFDQLSPAARDVAGLAAAVGRDFTLDLLVEAADLDADSVVDAVDELWRGRIITERGQGYGFSHDLLRDAAFDLVTPPRRWLLHRRLAQSLELMHRDDPAPVAALLAEQYDRGGRPARAVEQYRVAARQAAAVFAHAESVRLLERALTLLRAQPVRPSSAADELALLEEMAPPLNAWFGYASDRLQVVLDRSAELSERLGRPETLLRGLIGLWICRFVQGHVCEADALAQRALAALPDGSAQTAAVYFGIGGTSLTIGRTAVGLDHLLRAADLQHESLLPVGTRPDVHARAWSAHGHVLVGDDAAARAACDAAVALARETAHAYSLAQALGYAAITHQMLADRDAAAADVEELAVLCRRYDFAYYREWGLVVQGWLLRGTPGAALARQGIARLREAGALVRMPYWLCLLADVLAEDDEDAASSTLDAAAADARARADLWWLPEVERRRARFDPAGPALARLRAAADLARGQGSHALARRCEADLADLAER